MKALCHHCPDDPFACPYVDSHLSGKTAGVFKLPNCFSSVNFMCFSLHICNIPLWGYAMKLWTLNFEPGPFTSLLSRPGNKASQCLFSPVKVVLLELLFTVMPAPGLITALTTDDATEMWHRLTLAACYQLAQSVFEDRFCASKKGGIGEVDGFTPECRAHGGCLG